MALFSTVTGCRLGLCPKSPVLRTADTILFTPPQHASPGRPDGGAGGSKRMILGMSFALSGAKTLIRNTSLLWFPFFTGLVLAGLFTAHYSIRVLSVYPYDAIDLPRWLVLAFVTELATVFCLSLLLAALVLSLSHGDGRPLSFREGLARAKESLGFLADWSAVMALACMLVLGLVYLLNILAFEWFRTFFSPSPILFSAFRQFPFDFILLPEYHRIGPVGGTFATETGLTNTLVFSAVNLLLFVLTLFVIPQLVIERKNLKEAIRGSAALMKTVWREAVACVLVLGMAVSAALLASLLFPVTYAIFEPGTLFIYYPGDGWIAAALIYLAALCGFVFAAITVGGIAAVDLYRYAQNSRPPVLFERE